MNTRNEYVELALEAEGLGYTRDMFKVEVERRAKELRRCAPDPDFLSDAEADDLANMTWADYCVIAAAEIVNMERYYDAETQAEEEIERASLRARENAGYWEAVEQEEREHRNGVVSFHDAFHASRPGEIIIPSPGFSHPADFGDDDDNQTH